MFYTAHPKIDDQVADEEKGTRHCYYTKVRRKFIDGHEKREWEIIKVLWKLSCINPNNADKCSIKTFSPAADMLLLPSASRAERDPMPIDGKTAISNIISTLV